MSILESRESMQEFLDVCDSGDPLKDFYTEADLARALCELIREMLEDSDEEE